MKQYLKLGLLMVLIALFGGVFGQRHTPIEIYDADQQAFRNEISRLDSLCEAFAPRADVKKSADKWFEPSVITMYDLNSNPTHRHSWTYVDANCVELRNILTEVWEDYNLEQEEFVNARRRTFEYDDNGNWIKGLIEVWDGNAWIDDHRFACTYDDKNRMIFETQDHMYDGVWKGNIRWTNKWDDSDRLLDRMFERPTEDGVWIESMHQVWEYDASGNLLKELLSDRKPDLTWVKSSGWIYTYDENGYRITGVAIYQDGFSGRETYTNDEKGNRLSRTNEKYEEETWVKSWGNEWTYNDKNLMVTQNYNRFIDNEWVTLVRQAWKYFESGKCSKWNGEVYKENEWIGEFSVAYTYDANDRLLTLDREDYYPDLKEWLDVYQEVYTYDSKGHKLTETWKTYMGEIFTTALDFSWTYDENGNSTLFEATAAPEKIAAFLYYNNGLAEYGLPYFLTFTATVDYTDIRNGVPVTAVTLNKSNLDMKVKEQAQLEATVNPAEATSKEIRWSSSDDKIATVNSEGVVTATGGGAAVITVKTVDGGFTATCNVNVQKTSVNDLNAEHISVFYSNDLIVINSDVEIADVRVRDITGRIVYQANNADSIQTSSWNTGIYIVNVVDANKATKTGKILVK